MFKGIKFFHKRIDQYIILIERIIFGEIDMIFFMFKL